MKSRVRLVAIVGSGLFLTTSCGSSPAAVSCHGGYTYRDSVQTVQLLTPNGKPLNPRTQSVAVVDHCKSDQNGPAAACLFTQNPLTVSYVGSTYFFADSNSGRYYGRGKILGSQGALSTVWTTDGNGGQTRNFVYQGC
jgi:hypothetical protein